MFGAINNRHAATGQHFERQQRHVSKGQHQACRTLVIEFVQLFSMYNAVISVGEGDFVWADIPANEVYLELWMVGMKNAERQNSQLKTTARRYRPGVKQHFFTGAL